MRISDWSSDVCSSDLLLFDALSSNTNLHWTLTGPRGVEVDQRTIAYSDSVDLASSLQPLMDLPAGDYVLTIGGFEAGGGADDYAFRLLDLARAEAAALAAAINASFQPPGQTKVFRLPATG